MNTSTKSIAIGNQLYFFREGRAVEAGGVCSRTNLPATDDPGWLEDLIGNVETSEDALGEEKEEMIKGPIEGTGVIGVKDVVQTQHPQIDHKFTTNEYSRFAHECYYRTQQLDDASTYATPGTNPPPQGWLLIQRKDHKGQWHLVATVWVRIKCVGGIKGGDGNIVKPEWSALVLYTANNIHGLNN